MKPFEDYKKVGNLLFVSGQLPKNSAGEVDNTLSLYDQVIAELTAIETIAKEVGSCRNNVIKTNVFVTDISRIAEINQAYNDFFTDRKPTRSAFEISRLVGDVTVEIDAIVEIVKTCKVS